MLSVVLLVVVVVLAVVVLAVVLLALQLLASEAAPQLLRPGRRDHLYPRNPCQSAASLVEATGEQRKGPRGRTSRR